MTDTDVSTGTSRRPLRDRIPSGDSETVRHNPGRGFQERRYVDDHGTAMLSGVQALVRLPLLQMRLDAAAGRNTAALVSGYEGSPLAGYDLELGRVRRLLEEHRVVFQPAVNEELAATAIGGSQLVPGRRSSTVDGVLGVWYGKSPGLDRASDAIRHGNVQGADHRGGALLIVGDDPATKSSSLPSASELALMDLGVPVLYPGTVAEVIDYGLYAIAMSRLTGLWTSLKMVVGVADATSTVALDAHEPMLELAQLGARAHEANHRHVATPLMSNPVRLRLERDLFTTRMAAAQALLARFELNRVLGADLGAARAARIGIVAAGKTYYDVRQALGNMGLDDVGLANAGLRLMKIGALYPTTDLWLKRMCEGLEQVIVVEEKRGLLEPDLKQALYGVAAAPQVVGKRDHHGAELFPSYGELDVDSVQRLLTRQLAGTIEGVHRTEVNLPRERLSLTVLTGSAPTRTPHFCSGCPHSRSTPVPDGSLVGAGIGCHAMVTRSSREDLGELLGLTQMGGEGGQWIGLEPFVSESHSFQNLGDGTLMHSGTLAIRAAVAAGSHITYKILYNSAVAMTGGQEPAGMLSVPALTQLLTAEGVSRIIVTTDQPRSYRRAHLAKGTSVWRSDRLLEAQTALRDVAGVSVLIHDQECAAELRRKRKRGKLPPPARRVLINERVCEGCGDCGQKSNCLSVIPVETEFGGKTQIHQESCNFDEACVQGHCPSFLTVRVDGSNGEGRRGAPGDVDISNLPEPRKLRDDDFTMRVTGIGGTGIVTAAQIIGMAGSIAGWHATGLDQTGLAQKGGPVVSDLKVSKRPKDGAAKLAQGECDLYLVADVLTGIEPTNLAVASTSRTIAVVSTSEVPPGGLIGQPFKKFPETSPLIQEIAAQCVPNRVVALDALAISNRLFGNDTSANLLLLGAAYQSGAIPVPASFIEQAITLNGVAVETNIQAFRRGRQAVAAPEELEAALSATGTQPGRPPRPLDPRDAALIDTVDQADGELRRLLEVRVPELVAYQNRQWASDYVRVVAQARAAELQAGLPDSAYSEAVARYLYKLMAYKDEYEVARLHLEALRGDFVTRSLGQSGRASVHLLPPSLTRFGLRKKLRMGGWVSLVLSVLHVARGLRGTPLDPFGRHPIRRLERSLIPEYVELIRRENTVLSRHRGGSVELASSPDLIRGYDHVKLQGVERYRARVAELLDDK